MRGAEAWVCGAAAVEVHRGGALQDPKANERFENLLLHKTGGWQKGGDSYQPQGRTPASKRVVVTVWKGRCLLLG